MAMPETKGAGKLLEKGKQAYLCTFTMKNQKYNIKEGIL